MYEFSFEKLRVWKSACDLVTVIYAITKQFPDDEKYGLISHLRRASISISSNIAEGSGRISGKDQAKFTNIAYSSLLEVYSQCVVSEQLGYISAQQLKDIKYFIKNLSPQINSLRKSQLNKIQEPEALYNTQSHIESETEVQSEKELTHLLNKIVAKTIDSTSQLDRNYFVHPTSIIDNNCKIGAETKIWHFSHIMTNSQIGKKCNIGQNVVISPEVKLGNNVKVQNNVSIYTGVICEDDVFLGPSMVFTNVINPRSAVNRKDKFLKTVVKKGASIGANATIICGNDIGEYAFIGAGAVVTKSVPNYALVVGNPSQQIGWVSEYGHRLDFNDNGVAICKETKEEYLLKNGSVVKSIKTKTA